MPVGQALSALMSEGAGLGPLLIAVLEGREIARCQYRGAVLLSAAVLLEARASQAPEASARGYDSTRPLTEEFFPDQVGATGHADPGATNVCTPAGYREALGGRLEITAQFGGDRIVLG
jgi:hypothetical protein